MTSLRAEAKLFQKYSNAVMKFERGVSIQGISSMKTTFFSASDCSINCSNIEKASIQSLGKRAFGNPLFSSDSLK